MEEKIKMNPLESLEYKDKIVLFRPDINCPLDPKTKKIVNDNRIVKSLPTLKYLTQKGAKTVIIAHQGDTLDYDNLISMEEHAERLSGYLDSHVEYIDDVCGKYAVERIRSLKKGETILAGNLRYLTEEVSTFENYVNINKVDMISSWPVRTLGRVCELYVNDAFSAAHRNSPSMTAFQKILPCAAGRLLFKEYSVLKKVMENPGKKVFLLGGAKISDAFGMLNKVLEEKKANKILTLGITGQIMLMANGYRLGKTYEKYLEERGLLRFINPAKDYLKDYRNVIEIPKDIAYKENGHRKNIDVCKLPVDFAMFSDIGPSIMFSK